MTYRVFTLLCICLCQGYAAEPGLTGSLLGYLFDPVNGVQPILGMPGAATIGAPLSFSKEIARVSVPSQQNYALAIGAPDTSLLLLRLGDPIEVGPLSIPIANAGLVAFSPDGTAAAIHDRERNRILVLSGLPAAALVNEFDLSGFAGAVESIAINDWADSVLVGFTTSVIELNAGGVTSFDFLKQTSAMRYLSRSRDAIVADRALGVVYLVRNTLGAVEPTVLLTDIPEPVAVALSNDNKRAFVASSSTGLITEVELATGAVTATPCACRPSGLVSLNGNAVFRLTEPSGSAVWLFDGDGMAPRTVFIPPYTPPTAEAPPR